MIRNTSYGKKRDQRLSPSEINVLKALQKNDLFFSDLKNEVKSRDRESISPRGLSTALNRLQNLKLIERLPSRKYRIKSIGNDYLERQELIQSIQNKPVHYSKEIVFNINTEAVLQDPKVHLQLFENFLSPLPINVSFFGSENIMNYMIDLAEDRHEYNGRADVREFSSLILEENASPLKPYLNETIFNNCVDIARQYREFILGGLKERPSFDLLNVLDFDWGFALLFEGKRIMKKIMNDPIKLKVIKERLVGLILLNLPVVYRDGCGLIIPLMVASKLIGKKEGEELQRLYEKIHGKEIFESQGKIVAVGIDRSYRAKGEELENAKSQFLIRALEHVKKGNGLHIPKRGRHYIEGYESKEEDIFKEIVDRIENPH